MHRQLFRQLLKIVGDDGVLLCLVQYITIHTHTQTQTLNKAWKRNEIIRTATHTHTYTQSVVDWMFWWWFTRLFDPTKHLKMKGTTKKSSSYPVVFIGGIFTGRSYSLVALTSRLRHVAPIQTMWLQHISPKCLIRENQLIAFFSLFLSFSLSFLVNHSKIDGPRTLVFVCGLVQPKCMLIRFEAKLYKSHTHTHTQLSVHLIFLPW